MLCFSEENEIWRKKLDNENVEEERRAQNPEDDEISLIDLLAVLLRHKWLIIITTVLAMVFAVVFSVISLVLPPEKSYMPNLYTPKALMLINDETSSSGSLSSMISASGLGGLASLAGISGGGSSYSGLATYFVTTNSFLDAVVDEFDLVERFEIEKSPRAESREVLKKLLTADFDEESSVFSLSFTDKDPEFAKRVVDFSVKLIENMFLNLGIDKNLLEKKNLEQNIDNSYKEILNLQKRIQSLESSVSYGSAASLPAIMTEASMIRLELEAQQEVYKQLKTQYELLKIKMASETPIFQVIEDAEVPDRKSKPSRGMLCIIITFAAFFISVFFAFALNAVENVRKDPEAMEKLRSGKKK